MKNTSRMPVIAGSSPRVWGTRRACWPCSQTTRFIPACVGNAALTALTEAIKPVHPRVCGERGELIDERPHALGSSPRVWGTRITAAEQRRVGRFIPACVGNAWQSKNVSIKDTVHPRVCGEREEAALLRYEWAGSSPRVWGTPGHRRRAGAVTRFIPACVGNANWLRDESALIPVHPRVCGERRRCQPSRPLGHGSSPRVWGTPLFPRAEPAGTRFIPACVGNAVTGSLASANNPVHPRVCGERVFRCDFTMI